MVAVVARTAAAHGAQIATRVRVTGFRAPGEVEAVDEESGEPLLLRARHVAARGRRVDRRAARAGRRALGVAQRALEGHPRLRPARAHPDGDRRARPHREERPVRDPVAGRLADRRHRHALERRARRGRSRPAPTSTTCSSKANTLLAEPLRRDDVHGVTAGLRPLVAEAARSDTTKISRKHVVESPAPGLTTIAGGKYTTYRVMAADVIDAVARALGSPARVGDARRAAARRRPARHAAARRRAPPLRRPRHRARRADGRAARPRRPARRRRRAPARRGRPRLHARGRAPSRGRARAADPARAHRPGPRAARGGARRGADGGRARLVARSHAARGRGVAGARRRRPRGRGGARGRPRARGLQRHARRAGRRPGR